MTMEQIHALCRAQDGIVRVEDGVFVSDMAGDSLHGLKEATVDAIFRALHEQGFISAEGALTDSGLRALVATAAHS